MGAQSVSCCSTYGQVPTSFSYDNVQCAGTETTLNACPHLNTHDCGSREGAGVVCRTATSTTATGKILLKNESNHQSVKVGLILLSLNFNFFYQFNPPFFKGNITCSVHECGLIMFCLKTVALVGGTTSSAGVLYASNPVNGIYGPVCDDYFTQPAVSIFKYDLFSAIKLRLT